MARRSWILGWCLAAAALAGVTAELGLSRHGANHVSAHVVHTTPHYSVSAHPAIDWSKDIGTYNCAGLAFGNYRRMSMDEMEGALSRFRRLDRANAPCPPGWMKVWVWEYDVHHETEDGLVEAAHRDGHVVAGQTSAVDGSGPGMVYCKYGLGPVLGPAAAESWVPPAREEVGVNRMGKRVYVVRENVVERWYCAPESAMPK